MKCFGLAVRDIYIAEDLSQCEVDLHAVDNYMHRFRSHCHITAEKAHRENSLQLLERIQRGTSSKSSHAGKVPVPGAPASVEPCTAGEESRPGYLGVARAPFAAGKTAETLPWEGATVPDEQQGRAR